MQKWAKETPLRDLPRFMAPMKPVMVPRLPDDRTKTAKTASSISSSGSSLA